METTERHTPDILNCLANLSSDEVFTSPELANRMLDLLPQELFSNPKTTFLDPCCKSGVFLREIAKRLLKGLEKQIPDLQKRIDHIMNKQVFGIALTRLTAEMGRRTLYCAKKADGEYSVATCFKNEQGNLRYMRCEHTWENGKCNRCGANRAQYDRIETIENYAYPFIHKNLNKIFQNMQFDVIIGNPPYQLSDGGGTGSSALPIYHEFVNCAMELNPKYLVMIIPSRWFSGGRGLDDFRVKMLNDKRIRILHDYIDASDCFPGVEIKGGVCYFLWDRDEKGMCSIYTHKKENTVFSERYLLEKGTSTFIRNMEMVDILHKVQKQKEKTFDELVSSNDPFGFDVRVENSYKRIKPNYRLVKDQDSVAFYYNGWRKEGVGYVSRESVRKKTEWINKCKIYIPKAWGVGDMSSDWLSPFIVKSESCCTETYLVVGPFDDEHKAENVLSYMQTKFFHLMVSLIKITQNTMKKSYSLVPLQDFSHPWTDEMLYKKYNLSKDEIAFIESMIQPEKNTSTYEDPKRNTT